MKKEDYMKLSKERLAELLEKMDNERIFVPSIQMGTQYPPCYAPDGICTNPFHDCINCPRQWGGEGHWTTNTTINNKKL